MGAPSHLPKPAWESPRVILLMAPFFLTLLLFLVIPAISNLYWSFFSGPSVAPLSDFQPSHNYFDIVADASFWSSLLKGLFYGSLGAILQIGLGLLFALAFQRYEAYRITIYIPALFLIAIPPAAYVAGVRILFDSTDGLLSGVSQELFGTNFSLLASHRVLLLGSIITATQYFPISYLLFAEGIRQIPASLTNQAELDNLTYGQKLIVLILPSIFMSIIAALLIRFAITFGKFDTLYFLAGSSAMYQQVETTPLFVFNEGYQKGSLGRGFAASNLLLCLFLTSIIAFSNRAECLKRHFKRLAAKRLLCRSRIVVPAALSTFVRWTSLAVFILLTAGPFILFLGSSISPNFPRTYGGFSLESYHLLFGDYSFGSAVSESIVISTISAFAAVICAMPVVFVLRFYSFPSRNLVNLVFAIAYLVPSVVWVFASRSLYGGMDYIHETIRVSACLMGFVSPLAVLYSRAAERSVLFPDVAQCTREAISATRFFFSVYISGYRTSFGLAFIFCFSAVWADYLYSSLLGAPELRTGIIAFQEILHGAVVPWGVLMAAAVVICMPVALVLLIYLLATHKRFDNA